MLVIKNCILPGKLAFAITSIVITIIVSYQISISDVQGQETEENGDISAAAAINMGKLEVSIVPGAAALGDKAYSPNPINIRVGETIVWINDDTSDTPFHTVTSGSGPDDDNKGQEFDSGLSGTTSLVNTGTTFTHTFDSAGEFSYFCQLHPLMIGKIVVI